MDRLLLASGRLVPGPAVGCVPQLKSQLLSSPAALSTQFSPWWF